MNDRGRVYLIVGIIVAVGLLLSVVLGAVAGGVAGYFMGREQARQLVQTEMSSGPVIQPEQIVPRLNTPQTPQRTPFARPPVQIPGMGATLADVTAGSPADAAGLRAGDVILAVNDERVTLAMDLAQIVGKYRPGDTVKVTYSRDGKEATTDVILGQHPDNPERPYMGVTYTTVFPQPDGSR